MAAKLPDGATIAISTTYGSPKTVTGISNANPAVASAATHGYANGALLEFKSGWQRINDRIIRVAGQTAGTFNLDGIDSTSTQFYASGTGGGTTRELTAFTEISQIIGFSTSGGDQQFVNYSFLAEDFERQLPSITSAQSIKIEIADDPSLAGYIATKLASDARALRCVRLTLPDGSFILYNGIVSLNETPTVTKGAVMAVSATLSLQSKPMRYAS